MSSELSWFKSSYSDDQGSACLEVAYAGRKPNRTHPHTTHVRDTKLGAEGPQFVVAAQTWAAFVAHARGA